MTEKTELGAFLIEHIQKLYTVKITYTVKT